MSVDGRTKSRMRPTIPRGSRLSGLVARVVGSWGPRAGLLGVLAGAGYAGDAERIRGTGHGAIDGG